jgi:hypothetical protein
MEERGLNGWKALGFETYQDYLNSEFWKNKRDWIIQTRGAQCEKCGGTFGLQVHHLSYENVGNEGKDDVIVLCSYCHLEAHYGK